MPPSLHQSVKDRVIRLWFSGETRKNIATECQIGAGSVTNIVEEWTKGLEASDLRWIRELAVQLKKEGTTLAEFTSIYRRHKFIKKLGANENQIESLIVNLLDGTKSVPIEQNVDLVNQLFELSKSESIPPAGVPNQVKRKIEEKHRIESEIIKACATLHDNNVNIQTIEAYQALKDELKRHGLSIENPRRFASILQTIDHIGNNPRKIIRELEHMKSLKQTERNLKNSCEMWESRANQYKEIVPACEQIVSFGVGFHELAAFHVAILKKTDMENLPFGTAAYALLDGIDTSSRLADMKKELNDICLKIQMMNHFSARQNAAVIALAKMQYYGISENQILHLCKTIEANDHMMNDAQAVNLHT
jgi:hypothetical protein